MPTPKLQRIVDTIADRAAVITIANGYYTDIGAEVFRDRRPPQVQELPAMMIYLGERIGAETQSCRTRCDHTITVSGYVAVNETDSSEELGIQLLADIQKAIEIESDSTLSGELNGAAYGMVFASDEIYLPDTGEDVVGARVTYSIPHIRKYGDAEIA